MADSGTKLQRSSSLAYVLSEADGASNTVLPAEPGCSSQLPELQKEPGLLESGQAEAIRADGGSANHYFVVHVENSPGNGLASSSTNLNRKSLLYSS